MKTKQEYEVNDNGTSHHFTTLREAKEFAVSRDIQNIWRIVNGEAKAAHRI